MKFSVIMRGGAQMGILWTGIEKVAVYGISFVQSVILARLLCPEDFGLTAMLGIFLCLGGTLSESGLGTALVIGVRGRGPDARRLERQVLAWTVGTAAAIYALLAVTAPWCAHWYGNPLLTPILRAMAAGLVINALSVVATARLTREQRFGRLAWANGLSSIVGATVAIVLAWKDCGVWAIVGMSLVSATVRCGLVWWFARDAEPDETTTATDGMDFHAALRYGWKLMLSGLIHVVYMESYNMVIGKMWSPAVVGLFSRGQRLAKLPAEVVNEAVGRVALPALVQPNGAGSLRFACINAALLWPGLVVLLVWAPQVVSGVLGAQWLDCVPYLRILVVGQFFTAIGNVALHLLRARGRSDLVLKTDMWKKPVGFAALVCGIPFGVTGLCWAKVVSDVAECVADVAYALKCRADAADPPIDLVYCWYSGKIPDGVDKCRASDNGELYYSIRSVDRCAPWIRHIHVLVNDDAVISDWLSRHAKVRIVRLSSFIPGDVLPLNNSASIEMWLHRVPDLSERFVYSNDDMFLGRPVSPRDFFDVRGRMICRYSGYGAVGDHPGDVYEGMLRYSRDFLNDSCRRYPHHNMDGYLKSVIEDFWTAYPDAALRSGGFRYRVPCQLHRDVFSCYAVKTGRGVRRLTGRRVRLRRLLGLAPYTSLFFSLADEGIAGWLREDRPKFFCLNDTEACTEADRAKVRMLLKEVYDS